MKKITLSLLVLVASLGSAVAAAQGKKYPPLDGYLMPRDAEIAWAASAAPENITKAATIRVLTARGFETARAGTNGFVCEVMRGFSAPTHTPKEFREFVYEATIRSPICFDAVASRTVLPYYDLRTKLGLAGKSPDEITAAVAAAYSTGQLPKREAMSFAYMFSSEQALGPGIGHWRPHLMVFAPYADNAMFGNEPGKGLPQLGDDAGSPFAVLVIPLDQAVSIKPKDVR